MKDSKLKCIIILSSKSSGSSALQNLLANFPQVNHITKTRHFEYETLFWTKAASVLGLPQVDMLDSEVPIGKEKAKSDLVKLLKENIAVYTPPNDEKELIFVGWKLLCEKYSPVFLEKSPHHLHQWSALELILKCIEKFPEIDFLLIGLVRNPMAALYSSWDRMRADPEKNQYEWFTAYTNLMEFRSKVSDKLIIVRYEDLVRDVSCLEPVLNFIDVKASDNLRSYMHMKSVQKWRNDRFYGFRLSEEVTQLAEKFGYGRDELENESSTFWPLYKDASRSIHRVIRRTRRALGSF